MASFSHQPDPKTGPHPFRLTFDRFELNLRSGELYKDGRKVRLQAQPFQLLALLIEHAGEVATREEVCQALWPADTFVDFDHGLAVAVNKIREALNDSADNPRFIETLPKRGYRFIAPIERLTPRLLEVPASSSSDLADSVETPRPASLPAAVTNETAADTWRADRRAFGWIGVALVILAIGGLSWFRSRPRPEPPALDPVPFTSYPGMEYAPTFSPDGSHIAFAWDGGSANETTSAGLDLYVKAIGSETLLRLTHHPSQWISPAWSPDGTQIAFHRFAGADTGIYVVPALGGPERKLRSTHIAADLAAMISWSPDGKWIAYGDTVQGKPGDRIFLLSMDTLESRQIPHRPECDSEADLTFQHRGSTIAFVCVRDTTDFDLLTLPFGALGKETPKRVSSLPSFVFGMAWSSDDKRLIVSQDSDLGLWLDEVTIGDGTVRRLPLEPAGDWPAVSPTGHRLAYSTLTDHLSIHRKDLAQPGAPIAELTPSTRQQNLAEYSPDGKHVAFDSMRAGMWRVWVADADGSNPVQISRHDLAGFPRWSPDSRKVAFEVRTAGHYGVYIVDIAERVPRKLASNVPDMMVPSWSHDGKWIYFLSNTLKPEREIYRCPATGGIAQFLGSTRAQVAPIESLDGRDLYFASWNFKDELRVIALDGSRPESVVPGMPALADQGLWTVVRGGIYFVPESAPQTVAYFDFATKRIHQVFKLQKDFEGGLSVSPGGRYILFSQVDEKNSNIMLVDRFH
jgi:Tol biopolymer transport system component/DNA-binding winged helix-turn-helix (wHTH) protein